MCASASGNGATSCVRTATNSTGCDRATAVNAAIGGATAILVVRITISSTIVTAATGYNGSASSDRSTAIGDTASIGGATSSSASSSCSTSSCSTPGAGALAPDQDDLSVLRLSVIRRNGFEEIFWKDRNRRTHCRQGK